MLDEKENQTIENTEQTEEEAQKQAEETGEQAGEEAQEQDEIVDDEQLEIEREIDSYQSKIEQLDAKIAELEAKKVIDDKRELMRKWCYTAAQIDLYIDYIDGETAEEIEQSIAKLAEDIAPKGDNFADPSPMNHAKQKPAAADPGEVGKTLFERIKHRIWGGGATL